MNPFILWSSPGEGPGSMIYAKKQAAAVGRGGHQSGFDFNS